MFCPLCHSEYIEGVIDCPECDVPLAPEAEICRECWSVGLESGVCRNCGRVYHEGFRCFNHPSRLALYLCSSCRFQLCARCVKRRFGRSFCKTHADAWPFADGLVVYTATNAIEAGFLVEMLERHGIPYEMLTPGYFNPHPAGPQSIRIMVPAERARQVEAILDNLLFCENCGVICLPESTSCYNCGEQFE